jgi:hypothetical protein
VTFEDDVATLVATDGRTAPRIAFGAERAREDSPCPECGAYYFALHADGCAIEECPFCGDALAHCDCTRAPRAG